MGSVFGVKGLGQLSRLVVRLGNQVTWRFIVALQGPHNYQIILHILGSSQHFNQDPKTLYKNPKCHTS